MVFLILKGQCQRYPSFDGSLRFSFPLFLLFDGIRKITAVLSSDDQAKMKEIVSVLFVVSIYSQIPPPPLNVSPFLIIIYPLVIYS